VLKNDRGDKTLLIYNDPPRGRLLSWIDRLRHLSDTRPALVHCDPLALQPPARRQRAE